MNQRLVTKLCYKIDTYTMLDVLFRLSEHNVLGDLSASVNRQEYVMTSTIFWDITPCSPLKVNRRAFTPVSCSANYSTLNMEAMFLRNVLITTAVRTLNPTRVRFINLFAVYLTILPVTHIIP
jgi:hypothetical protein